MAAPSWISFTRSKWVRIEDGDHWSYKSSCPMLGSLGNIKTLRGDLKRACSWWLSGVHSYSLDFFVSYRLDCPPRDLRSPYKAILAVCDLPSSLHISLVRAFLLTTALKGWPSLISHSTSTDFHEILHEAVRPSLGSSPRKTYEGKWMEILAICLWDLDSAKLLSQILNVVFPFRDCRVALYLVDLTMSII